MNINATHSYKAATRFGARSEQHKRDAALAPIVLDTLAGDVDRASRSLRRAARNNPVERAADHLAKVAEEEGTGCQHPNCYCQY